MKKNKDVDIKARVTRKMRAEVQSLADQRGEAVSIIIREAVAEYLAKRKKKKRT
jgi:predicted transcriptional regulator